ncbi:hypothetical protein [Haliea sp. E17]|uniref:hypothetical protein n=1 Tax=Haliea sp. E17 TaxID=3401576 RepID=UPI003AAA3253
MTTKSALKIASIGTLAAVLLTPLSSLAEVNSQSTGATQSSHSLVHRVSHTLANDRTYAASGNSGYKWAKGTQATETSATWATKANAQAGYKWNNAVAAEQNNEQGYASNANYQWGSMSFSEQSAYKWGLRNFSEQSAYKWGLRNFPEQSAYKWGLRSFSEQSAYKWGLRGFSQQSAYKWGLR